MDSGGESEGLRDGEMSEGLRVVTHVPLTLCHRADGTRAGCKQAVNYPKAGTRIHLKSAEDGIAHRVGRSHCAPSSSPSSSPIPITRVLQHWRVSVP